MSPQNFYNIPAEFAKNTLLNASQYRTLYQHALQAPDTFWGEQGKQFISWFSPFDQVRTGDFHTSEIRWYESGRLNACYNCVDRHLATRKDQIAIVWEGNDPNETKQITYQALFEEVCAFANVLKQYGIQPGDRVCIYLPMIPQAIIAMLACARIGAIHSVVFGGFSAEALSTRILDAGCRLLITADESIRGEKIILMKKNSDEAVRSCPNIEHVIVVQHTGNPVDWNGTRDIWYHEALTKVDNVCPAAQMDSSSPLFILYTSGSTGKPKGVLHSTAGYLVYAAVTHRYVFDYHNDDIFWCSADIGWITGHSYAVYGPLLNGGTTLIFEGVPHYPSFSRYWEIIDKHRVGIFYTAPTAIRALRREGDTWVKRCKRSSLKLLGTVGEPINPEVWKWYFEVVGEKRCPIVNTWWQTETGGILLTSLPGATPMIAGSVGQPFLGIVPDIVDDQGISVQPTNKGQLVIREPWPGLLQTIYGDHQRFLDTYLKKLPGAFVTGDGAYRDVEGDFWITGRTDDVIKVSGHRIGTEEVESALVSHPALAEAAVVGIPHDIKGESIYAFVIIKIDVIATDALKNELIQHVRTVIGPLAAPEQIQWTNALPKTRSGKIMRRLLRKIASKELNNLGDLSTLADASVIEMLIKGR